MKYVFIDSSMFLKMYSYDLSRALKDLIKLIDSKKIELIITEKILDEVNRYREARLKDTLNKVKKWKDSILDMPPFCENEKTIKLIKNSSEKVYDNLFKNSGDKTLEVDELFSEITEKSEVISISEELLKKARERFDRGNPPGKKGSYGDCINWLILLEKIPSKKDLYFIGGDKDFLSQLNEENFSMFLKEEWEFAKKSKIILYKSISKFLKEEFKEKIPEDQIKKEESIFSYPYHEAPFLRTFGHDIVEPVLVRPSVEKIYLSGDAGSDIAEPISFTGSEIRPDVLSGGYLRSTFWPSSIPTISPEREVRCPKCKRISYCKDDGITSCPYCLTLIP